MATVSNANMDIVLGSTGDVATLWRGRLGVYRATGETYAGKPYWRRPEGEGDTAVLYFNEEWEQWLVGADLGTGSEMRNLTPSFLPPTHGWQFGRSDGGWRWCEADEEDASFTVASLYDLVLAAKGKASELWQGRLGTYKATGKTNSGKPYWMREDESAVLYFSEEFARPQWLVGASIGTGVHEFRNLGDFPMPPARDWEFGSLDDDGDWRWCDAAEDPSLNVFAVARKEEEEEGFEVVEGGVRKGYRLVTMEEARDKREAIVEKMSDVSGEFCIARLAGGWKIGGVGYKKKIKLTKEDESLDHCVIVKEFLNDDLTYNVRVVERGQKGEKGQSFRLATKEEVEKQYDDVMDCLGATGGEWCIAALARGWKIGGEGYGGKIERRGADEKIGHKVVVGRCDTCYSSDSSSDEEP